MGGWRCGVVVAASVSLLLVPAHAPLAIPMAAAFALHRASRAGCPPPPVVRALHAGVGGCLAHKGIAGNEKADQWAKTAAEKPRTRGVEHLVPLPRSLANLKREISEKKWAEARQWAGWRPDLQGKVSATEKPEAGRYGSRQHQEARLAVLPAQDGALPDRTVPQLDEEPTRWWCRYQTQTRDHLFKECPE